VKITYFSKRERKKGVTGLILGKKLTLNHPSLMDEGEETTVLVTAHKREEGERERESLSTCLNFKNWKSPLDRTYM